MPRSGTDANQVANRSGYAAVYARVSTEDQWKGFSFPRRSKPARTRRPRRLHTLFSVNEYSRRQDELEPWGLMADFVGFCVGVLRVPDSQPDIRNS
jgi:hypothetical protein